MTTSINPTVDTTIPTASGPDVDTSTGRSGRMGRRSRWLLAGVAAAIAVPVTLSVTRSDRAPATPVDTPAVVAGLPATPDDLRYAAEWARRVEAMTQDVVVEGLPATTEDLRYAAEWARRVEAMTAAGQE